MKLDDLLIKTKEKKVLMDIERTVRQQAKQWIDYSEYKTHYELMNDYTYTLTSYNTTDVSGLYDSIPGTGNAKPYTVYLRDYSTIEKWLFEYPSKKVLNKNIKVI
jgi:hypothetical protein